MDAPNKSSLSEKDHENMDAFLGTVLDDYRAGDITREQAVGGLTHIVAALESGNYEEAAHWFQQGHKLIKLDLPTSDATSLDQPK